MRRWFLGLAVAVVAAGAAAADDKAAAVVKKAIGAHGGADNLNKYTAGKFTMKGDMSIMGMDLEFTGSAAYALPDKYRLNIALDIGGMKVDINHVVKGEKAKSTVTANGMTQNDPGGEAALEELKAAAVMQEAEQLTPLLNAKRFDIKSAEDADVNGRKAAVVVVTPKTIKKELKMFFDKDSGLLVKTARRGLNPDGQGGEVDEETFHNDYKKVNGVQVPSKLVIHHDGKKFMSVELGDYEVLEKLDDKEFTTDD